MMKVLVPYINEGDVFDIARKDSEGNEILIAEGVSLPYIDPNGTIYHWYSVRNVTDSLNPSPWSPWFKAEPETPRLCKVKGYVYNWSGQPLKDIEVIFIADQRSYIQNVFVKHGETLNVYTDNNGYWEAWLIQGLKVRIKIPELELDELITIPEQNECFIEELL